MPERPHLAEPRARAELLRGIGLGVPIFLGYVPIGIAFGILATSIGFSAFQAFVCSATALAGAGQFIALALMKSQGSILAVLAATTVVNLRYVLFGATLSPYLRRMPLRRQAFLAFTLTDETFAVNIGDRRAGLSSGWSMAGVGAIAWAGWVTGTLLGSVASAWIGDPTRFGVDFAMPAMFTALLVALAEDRRHVAVATLAGVLTLTLPALGSVGVVIPSSWNLMVSAVASATAAALLFSHERGHAS